MFVVVPIDYSLLTPSFVEALHGKPMEGEFKLEVEDNDVNMDGLPTCGYITVHDKRFWIHLGSSPETQGCRVRRVDTTSEDPVLKSFGGVWTKFYPKSKDENLQKWMMNKLSDVIEWCLSSSMKLVVARTCGAIGFGSSSAKAVKLLASRCQDLPSQTIPNGGPRICQSSKTTHCFSIVDWHKETN